HAAWTVLANPARRVGDLAHARPPRPLDPGPARTPLDDRAAPQNLRSAHLRAQVALLFPRAHLSVIVGRGPACGPLRAALLSGRSPASGVRGDHPLGQPGP